MVHGNPTLLFCGDGQWLPMLCTWLRTKRGKPCFFFHSFLLRWLIPTQYWVLLNLIGPVPHKLTTWHAMPQGTTFVVISMKLHQSFFGQHQGCTCRGPTEDKQLFFLPQLFWTMWWWVNGQLPLFVYAILELYCFLFSVNHVVLPWCRNVL